MSYIEAGGPAFPGAGMYDDRAFTAEECGQGGMTLRDYFAANALAAMIANPNKEGANCGQGGLNALPGYAYEWADAMLKARAQSTTTVGKEG